MIKIEWETQKRKINALIPNPENPRQMTKAQVCQLQQSLEKFSLVEIPAINQDNTIIAGHQRINILLLLGRGEESIDVRVPSRLLLPDEVKEYMLRSNKNSGEWDFDLLSGFDEKLLKDIGFTDFDLGTAGFDQEEAEEPGRLDYYHKEIECPFCHKKFKRKVNDA